MPAFPPSFALHIDNFNALANTLSDLEAGTPRQWYWLEIAATQANSPGNRASRILDKLGPAWTWPWLKRSALPGVGLYASTLDPAWAAVRDKAAGGALYVAVTPALLAGLGLLPASQSFAAWLILLLGLLVAPWRIPAIPAPTAPDLPGPEECTGLTGLLLASGSSPQHALGLVAGLRTDPDLAWPALLQALPALAPPPPSRWQLGRLCAAGWLAGTLPAALLISLLPAPWGLLAAALASCGLIARLDGRRAALVAAGCTLLLYALGALAHRF
ncbi:hypothetical protein JHS3_20280 [Jeongeupia sp. HS-3]|uniref:hypothetical protein n=1 Tax=Jeongeupia sp. HS-3 TaxID=1009682 RepID=UPI0018A67971|nr:hypothetical protein [Jeongeupia sp. HS-3]BCL76292.1 hypothetical protein JHS3_20280 [Jeongeupia sp. HS-3]